jgi:hypothetical protein
LGPAWLPSSSGKCVSVGDDENVPRTSLSDGANATTIETEKTLDMRHERCET